MNKTSHKRGGSKPEAHLRLHFLGAAGGMVTGSFLLFEKFEKGKRDCFFFDMGGFQGKDVQDLPDRLPPGLNYSQLGCGFFSHTHFDHIGEFLNAEHEGYKGKTFMTQPALELMDLALHDGANIHVHEAKARSRPVKYTERDVRRCLGLIQGVDFFQKFSPTPYLRNVEFRPASHLLGAATIRAEVMVDGKKTSVVFSGDLGRTGMPLLPDPAPADAADFIICESTKGNSLNPTGDRLEALAGMINRAQGRASMANKIHGHGVILIPVFAFGRAQTIAFDLKTLIEAGRIPNMPVYLDSTLAIKGNAIHRKYCFPKKRFWQKKTDPLGPPRFYECTEPELKATLDTPADEPRIVIAASGMATGGRILHHLAHRLPGAQNSVLFVGHQSHGTLGAQLRHGADSVRISGEEVTVRAQVDFLEHYSGHGDASDIIKWLSKFKREPKTLFLVHGEDESREALKQRVKKELGWKHIVLPKFRDRIDLV